MSFEYELPVPTDARRRLARAWLILGLLALLGAGLFSVLLVAARTPYVASVIPGTDFFHTALVVHVDLSVLVWFLAFGGVLWSLNCTAHGLRLGWAAFALSALGAALMTLAPFTGAAHPLMSNYIPVLQQPLFLTGLVLFAGGITLLTLRAMGAIPPVGVWMAGTAALRFGLNTAAVATMFALIAFVWSWLAIPAVLSGKGYYELLFWGGGHVLQFTYTLLLLVAWLWLASASGVRLPITPRVALIFFAFGLATVFAVPIIYYAWPVTSPEHIKLFTWLMQYGGSLATLPLSLAVVHGLLRPATCMDAQVQVRAGARLHRVTRTALLTSILLFGFGGVIGFLIAGMNVTIPAHYHGSIVGVTLAFMGLTYYLMPKLGFGTPEPTWATRQLWLYGIGQFIHVTGLLWSGGYGVARKVAGAEQGLQGLKPVAAMGLMGLGGLIAIVGGVMFLVNVWRARRA
jgi:hypothetical protein